MIVSAGANGAGEITLPESYFGYTPGADREMLDYEELIGYLQKLDSESPKLKLVEIGESPQGRPIYIAFISSIENIADLSNLGKMNRRLALDPDIPKEERETIIDK